MLLAVTAIGPDRPNVLAAVTGVLVAHDGEITDARASVLAGYVNVALVVDVGDSLDLDELRRDLASVAVELGLTAIHAEGLPAPSNGVPADVTHVLTATGSDNPGILHAVTHQLARHGIRVCDLQASRVADDDGPALSVLMFELGVPAAIDAGALATALQAIGGEHDLVIELRVLDES